MATEPWEINFVIYFVRYLASAVINIGTASLISAIPPTQHHWIIFRQIPDDFSLHNFILKCFLTFLSKKILNVTVSL